MIRLKNSFSFSQQASQKAWCKQGGQDWISQLRCLLIVFSVQKSMSGTCHQSWVHQEVLRKPNISSLYWLRMWSESETSRRAFRDFSSQLMSQKSGLILQFHTALGSFPKISFLTLRVWFCIITAWRRQVLAWGWESANQWIWRWNQSE